MRQSSTCISTSEWQLALLAPSTFCVPHSFLNHAVLPDFYDHLLAGLQRLRGRVYLEDGAVERWQLTLDGRHKSEVDERSWHILAVSPRGEVLGCARYLPYPKTVHFAQLTASRAALARNSQWGEKLEAAVEEEVAWARLRGIGFVEVGGWALAHEIRCSMAALKIALASYSLARILGGCVSICTATLRHGSATMLRRVGATSIRFGREEMPPYFDPQYKCQMEILRFDSSAPNPKYEKAVEEIRVALLAAPVVSRISGLGQLQAAVGSSDVRFGAPLHPVEPEIPYLEWARALE